jgi:hypothetical protein
MQNYKVMNRKGLYNRDNFIKGSTGQSIPLLVADTSKLSRSCYSVASRCKPDSFVFFCSTNVLADITPCLRCAFGMNNVSGVGPTDTFRPLVFIILWYFKWFFKTNGDDWDFWIIGQYGKYYPEVNQTKNIVQYNICIMNQPLSQTFSESLPLRSPSCSTKAGSSHVVLFAASKSSGEVCY